MAMTGFVSKLIGIFGDGHVVNKYCSFNLAFRTSSNDERGGKLFGQNAMHYSYCTRSELGRGIYELPNTLLRRTYATFLREESHYDVDRDGACWNDTGMACHAHAMPVDKKTIPS